MMWLWGLIAGGAAVWQEYMYRTVGDFWGHIWLYLPVQILIGYGIYRLVTHPGTSLLDALIVFTFSTAMLRIIVTTVLLGDTVTKSTWIAFGLIVLARLVHAMGNRL